VTAFAITERAWQQQVLELATLYRWAWYHTHDSRRSPAGFPDLVLVRERLVFAELKTDKGRLSTNQLCWQNLLNHAGAEVYVWRPRDLDAVRTTLGAPTRSGAATARLGAG
jgi:hypothetical protein